MKLPNQGHTTKHKFKFGRWAILYNFRISMSGAGWHELPFLCIRIVVPRDRLFGIPQENISTKKSMTTYLNVVLRAGHITSSKKLVLALTRWRPLQFRNAAARRLLVKTTAPDTRLTPNSSIEDVQMFSNPARMFRFAKKGVQVPGARYLVLGIGCHVQGSRCQVPATRYSAPGIRYQ